MSESQPVRRYEDGAAVRKNVVGWCCRHCGRFWGEGPSGERAAEPAREGGQP